MNAPTLTTKAPDSGVLIFGLSDVASAVAHGLVTAGFRVVMVQPTPPTAHRRGMAFTDAYWDEVAILDGICCHRLATFAAWSTLDTPPALSLVTEEVPLPNHRFPIVIDARMQKRKTPPDLRPLAGCVIGLGPGFAVGQNCHIAIETSWGDQLGMVITEGATAPLSGEPRPIEGHGRERLLYAPEAGLWQTPYQIGDPVEAGTWVGAVNQQSLVAPLSGVLRGLTRSGLEVAARTKLVEVDPRGEQAVLRGLGERPKRIAAGVLSALAIRQSLVTPPKRS
ncbi:MAG: hypothetical protein ACO31Z_08525, partial [Litorivicinaceae bacterium]